MMILALSVVMTINAGVVCALFLIFAVQSTTNVYFPSRRQQISLMIAIFLLMAQAVASLLWDSMHDNTMPYAQFPVAIRLTLTGISLALADYGMWPVGLFTRK
jgi:hypothetical protein